MLNKVVRDCVTCDNQIPVWINQEGQIVKSWAYISLDGGRGDYQMEFQWMCPECMLKRGVGLRPPFLKN